MSFAPAVLRGLQEPRVSNVPPARSSAGPDAVEFAASVGLVLDPWQALVLEGAMGEDGAKWAAMEVGLIVSRQNGKGAILEARELAGALLFDERLIIHTAHLLSTSEEARLRMERIIESSPDLDRACKRVIRSNGKEAIEFKNGARIKYMARSKGSGRGLTGDLVVFDEAMFFTAEELGSMMPSLSAAPNPQLWYTGSAGFPTSTQLLRVRERVESENPGRLAYFEFSAPKNADLDSLEAWAQANPALGIRISEDFIESERAAMDETQFARERLGIWEDVESAQVIPLDLWEKRADPSSKMVGSVAFALDSTPDGGRSSVSAVARRKDGLLHVEIVKNAPGTGWLTPFVAELVAKWSPTAVSLDPRGPVGAVLPDLQLAGLEITTISSQEMAQACGGLLNDVVEGKLRHLGDPLMTSALAAARKRPLGDAWAWHRRDSTDISPLVAATVARYAFLTAEEEAPSTYEGRGMVAL